MYATSEPLITTEIEGSFTIVCNGTRNEECGICASDHSNNWDSPETETCAISSDSTSFYVNTYAYRDSQDAILTVHGNINNDVNCQYSDWSNWGNCNFNDTCIGTTGFGNQFRTRTRLDFPSFGHQCVIEKTESRGCNLTCPGTFWSKISNYCR